MIPPLSLIKSLSFCQMSIPTLLPVPSPHLHSDLRGTVSHGSGQDLVGSRTSDHFRRGFDRGFIFWFGGRRKAGSASGIGLQNIFHKVLGFRDGRARPGTWPPWPGRRCKPPPPEVHSGPSGPGSDANISRPRRCFVPDRRNSAPPLGRRCRA